MTTSSATDLARAAQLFHALSDETRLAALDMLRRGEQCVCDLQDAVDAAQSRLSFHLRVLKEAGLVEDRKDGRWSYYSIVPGALDEAHDLVVHFLPKSSAVGRGQGQGRGRGRSLRVSETRSTVGTEASRRCCG